MDTGKSMLYPGKKNTGDEIGWAFFVLVLGMCIVATFFYICNYFEEVLRNHVLGADDSVIIQEASLITNPVLKPTTQMEQDSDENRNECSEITPKITQHSKHGGTNALRVRETAV